MTEKEYLELLHKEVDGHISENERGLLREYLRENPQIKINYQEVIKTSDLRKQIDDIDPSPNLKKNIINTIDSNRYTADRNVNSERLSILDWFTSIKPVVAYSFAAGVMVGLIVYSLFLTDLIRVHEVDNINFYGTIGIPESANIQKLDQVTIDVTGFKGIVTCYKFDKILWFDIKTSAAVGCEIVFKFDHTKSSFSGLKPLDHLNTTLRNEIDKLNITINEPGHFLLLFTQESTENTQITMELLHTAETPFTYIFSTNIEK
jgi:hypothetical protein